MLVLHCNTRHTMDATISTRLDRRSKQLFLTKTREKWLEWSVLIRYFIEKFNADPDIVKFDIEERLFDDLMKNQQTVSKLEKISDKLDTLWF